MNSVHKSLVVRVGVLVMTFVVAVMGVFLMVGMSREVRAETRPGTPLHTPATNPQPSVMSVTLDLTFGPNGVVTTPIGSSVDIIEAIQIQDDGKIVVAGATGRDNGSNGFQFALARYNIDGSLDATWDTDGIVTEPDMTNSDVAHALALQGSKILMAGSNNAATPNANAVVVRYNDNGSIDTTFGISGVVTSPLSLMNGNKGEGFALAVQDDGKIIIAGGTAPQFSAHTFAAVRLMPEGDIDFTFGMSGVVTTAIGTDGAQAESIIIQDDGKIVLAGTTSGMNSDFAVAWYNMDGSLDTTFGTNGVSVTSLGETDNGRDVAIQDDGKIVVAGTSGRIVPPAFNFAVARYNTDGSLDDTFDTDGVLTTPIGVAAFASSVVIKPDGKIVVGGHAAVFPSQMIAVAQYNTDGSLDTSFDTDGILLTPIQARAADMRDVALQDDGKIVIGGGTLDNTFSVGEFVLARYTADGDTPPPVLDNFIYLPAVLKSD